MNNKKIRMALAENGVKYYELADLMGVSEATLGRKLRKEMLEEEQLRLVKLIEEAVKNG